MKNKKFNVKDRRVKLRKIDNCTKINYVNDIDAINVRLLNYPTIEELKRYIPELVMATWNEDEDAFSESLSDEDRLRFVIRTLQNKFIPTALRSINVTFEITGLSWHDVTHLIRSTGFSYAADCSGDKLMENRPIVVPEFLNELKDENGDILFKAYHEAMSDLMHIYDTAINSGKVHVQDARLMLPRTMTTFYYVTGGLDTCLRFISQRIDRQVQPKADNIIAMKLAIELTKVLPLMIDVDMPNKFYITESKTNFKSGWDWPNDINGQSIPDEYKKEELFVYGKQHRDDLIGNKTFVDVWNELKTQLLQLQQFWRELPDIGPALDACEKGDWK